MFKEKKITPRYGKVYVLFCKLDNRKIYSNIYYNRSVIIIRYVDVPCCACVRVTTNSDMTSWYIMTFWLFFFFTHMFDSYLYYAVCTTPNLILYMIYRECIKYWKILVSFYPEKKNRKEKKRIPAFVEHFGKIWRIIWAHTIIVFTVRSVTMINRFREFFTRTFVYYKTYWNTRTGTLEK